MPRRDRNAHHDREMRSAQAEDLEHKIDEAAGIATMIGSDLADGVNPPELAEAWHAIGAELTALLVRAQRLAR